MRKALVAAVVAVLIVVAAFFYQYYRSISLGDVSVSLIVRKGDSFDSVARQLAEQKVVSSRLMLKYSARLTGVDKHLIPGLYKFTGDNSISTVLDKLGHARFERIRLTVNEGAPVWKVASLLSHVMEIDSAALIALNRDTAFLNELHLPSLEGYLFPQTYFFPWGISLKEIVRQMIAMYHDQTDSLMKGPFPYNLSREETIILASIVEAEAKLDEEKPVIASVYYNRLRRRMKLQADPTVIYGLGGLDRPLYRKDLNKETAYNTYLHRGLPPTPINSPGLGAIKAALHPDSTSYLYFIADGSGRHRFSKTNLEHNRARREIKRNRHRRATNRNGNNQ